jgi:hypothetical protein
VLARVGVDKKRTGRRIGFVTLAGPGAPGITELPLTEVSRILRRESAP